MIGAFGVGKTAFFLYPNLEYACARGMSFLTTDIYRDDETNLAAKARAEKFAKIISKIIINAGDENFGQNQFFYDGAEGLLTAVILLIAEYPADHKSRWFAGAALKIPEADNGADYSEKE